MQTQFEQNLHNLILTLDSQKKEYRAKKWDELKTTELAKYRQNAEAEYAQGVELLRKKRDEAIAEREKELQATLDAEVEEKFSAAEQHLNQTHALFFPNETGAQ